MQIGERKPMQTALQCDENQTSKLFLVISDFKEDRLLEVND